MSQIDIYGIIGREVFLTDVKQQLRLAGGQPVELAIASDGGSFTEGLAIYSQLQSYPGKVTAIVDSLAASIASVIALAADELVMRANTRLMIHEAQIELGGYYSSQEMRETLGAMESVNDSIRGIYVQATGQEPDIIENWMQAETWFSPKQAHDAGFTVTIDEGVTADGDILQQTYGQRIAAVFKLDRGSAVQPQTKAATPRLDDIRRRFVT